ncbi:MAG TPA: hypothetical protein VE890_05675, partial [Thermoguttaceae bacterium]|nr:hypothetical protein [Thermoguttaceae bacterium]
VRSCGNRTVFAGVFVRPENDPAWPQDAMIRCNRNNPDSHPTFLAMTGCRAGRSKERCEVYPIKKMMPRPASV